MSINACYIACDIISESMKLEWLVRVIRFNTQLINIALLKNNESQTTATKDLTLYN